MKLDRQLFFELIRVSIGTQDRLSRMPSTQEWNALYDFAKKQSLVGVCFVGVQKMYNANSNTNYSNSSNCSNLSKLLYLNWMGLAAKIQQRNEVVNRQCVELQAKLSADGYRSYIMKGQANAALYQCGVKNGSECSKGPSLFALRQSGDIDVYLEGGLDKVLAYARTFGEITKVNELEMSVPMFQDTEVEFHYRPFIMRNPWKNRKLQAFFDACAEGNFANKVYLNENEDENENENGNENGNENQNFWITAPTTEFNLVHQLAHIHLHLFTEGVGMRQLMDYYFVLRTSYENHKRNENGNGNEDENDNENEDENDNEDENENQNENVLRVVHDLGLERFASALMWVIKTVFVGNGNEDDNQNENEDENDNDNGNDNKNFFLWEPNEKDGRFLLDEIMTSGNFGKHNVEQNERKGKMGYSLWALFARNLRLSRFDRGDWFWGPVWRISHKLINKRIY